MDRGLCKIAFLGFLACLTGPFAASAQSTATPGADRSGEIAVLRVLDKVSARHVDLQVPVGQTVEFATLDIRVDYCRSRPPEERPESFVLLSITERAPDREDIQVFDGWMLASLPSLNPLEHPVYDLWAVDCLMEQPAENDDTDG